MNSPAVLPLYDLFSWMEWDSNPTTFVISNGRLNLYDALPVELSIRGAGFRCPAHPPSIPKCQQIQFT